MHEALAKKHFERDTAILTEAYCARVGWVVNASAFPILDVTISAKRPLRLRCNCENWDEHPPSIVLQTEAGSPLELEGNIAGGIFNKGPHQNRPGAFVCMRGVLEYHQLHAEIQWASCRGQSGMNLVGILLQLAEVWRREVGQ